MKIIPLFDGTRPAGWEEEPNADGVIIEKDQNGRVRMVWRQGDPGYTMRAEAFAPCWAGRWIEVDDTTSGT
jgi:hypothetical protein